MESNDDGKLTKGQAIAFWILLAATIGVFALCFGSCTSAKTAYVPVTTVERDTVRQITHTHDTVYVRDSIYVDGEKEYRERLMWRDRAVHDTLYIARTDTIQVPYPVKSAAPKPKWSDTAFKLFGQACAIALLLWLLFLYIKRKR